MTREQKRQHWLNHIEAWQASDLSQAEYTRRHNLSVKTFQYHKRRYSQTPTDTTPAQTIVPVVVETPEAVTVPATSGITLVTPQGIKIELETGFNSDCLKRLLKALA